MWGTEAEKKRKENNNNNNNNNDKAWDPKKKLL
jgi:hypothetical protein